jgi:hypothetical protein
MKKQFLLSTAILFVGGSVLLTSCKKDEEAPVITVTGGATKTITLNSTLADPGATASDNEDGDVSASITSDYLTVVDKDKTGTYTVTYKVSDEAGNEGTATLAVTVKNDAETWNGNYNGIETDSNGPYTYTNSVVVTASTTKNNRISMTRLGDFANNTVNLDITGNDIDMPSQTVQNVGTGVDDCDVHNRTSQGSGTKTTTGFTLNYNDSKVAPCTGSRTNVNATFTKQ